MAGTFGLPGPGHPSLAELVLWVPSFKTIATTAVIALAVIVGYDQYKQRKAG